MIGATLLALLTGCAPGPLAAPLGSTIEVVEGGEAMTWILDAAYATPGDGVGLLIPQQAMVWVPTAAGDTVPGNNIRVEALTGWSGAYLLSASSVRTVNDLEVECEGIEDPTAREEAGCDTWFYDQETERYYEFSGTYEDVADFRPTYMAGVTDNRGIFDYYVFVDSVPVDEDGEALPIGIWLSIGVSSYAYELGE